MRKRVALCFRGAMDKIKSGHYSRSECDIYSRDLPYVPFEAVEVSLQKHLFDVNIDCDFDVFVHSWNVDLQDKFEDLYAPKAVQYENNKDYERDIQKNRVHNFAYTSQQLSICKSLQLMLTFAENQGITYDYVISYRPDALLYMDMSLKDYDPDTVRVNSAVFEDFHFVMSHSNATLFKHLYGSRMLIPQFVHSVMKKQIKPDGIQCGKHQEILRKLKHSCVNKGYHPAAFFEEYGLTEEQVDLLTHV